MLTKNLAPTKNPATWSNVLGSTPAYGLEYTKFRYPIPPLEPFCLIFFNYPRSDHLLNYSWTAFFYQFLKHPRQVGAVLPCSVDLAQAMRQALEANGPSENAGVVEFGPGTGGITRCLDTHNLTLVEIDQTFCKLLKRCYPNAQVLNLSAQEFLAQQKTPVTVVSSIPLLNNPHANAIKQAISEGYQNGVIQKLVTFSYGSKSPFAQCGFTQEERFKHVLRNVPPANVWIYR